MLKVSTLKNLRKLTKNNKEGETALVTENHTLYRWDGLNWITAGKTAVNASVYDINCSLYSNIPALEEDRIKEKIEELTNWRKETNYNYYMLLNKELNYYTILTPIGEGNSFGFEIVDAFQNLGKIKAIDFDKENEAYECWITEENKQSHVFYLFSYDKGVIKCQ